HERVGDDARSGELGRESVGVDLMLPSEDERVARERAHVATADRAKETAEERLLLVQGDEETRPGLADAIQPRGPAPAVRGQMTKLVREHGAELVGRARQE